MMGWVGGDWGADGGAPLADARGSVGGQARRRPNGLRAETRTAGRSPQTLGTEIGEAVGEAEPVRVAGGMDFVWESGGLQG